MTELPPEDESAAERLNRNLDDALNEIRVAMPGVQVLFGFLLAVPFQSRFADVTDLQRGIYIFTLLCSGVASACFIAPTAFHRLLFRHGDKEYLVFFATRVTVAGLIALAAAMNGAVLLITDVVFDTAAAIVAAGAMATVYVGLWFAVPLSRRRVASSRAREGAAS